MAASISPLASPEIAKDASSRLAPWLRVPTGKTPDVRLGVYVHGYPARIREALAESFPAALHVVGQGSFARLTERYVARVALGSSNLNQAGERLASFLEGDELVNKLPFLPDLAELEWRIACAFHAREEQAMDATLLAAWSLEDWEQAVLRFQLSVSVLRSAWPVHDVWEQRETPVGEIDIDLRDRPQNVLVFRAGLGVRCMTVVDDEAFALQKLLQGSRLGDVVDDLAERGQASDGVFAAFAGWMRAGLICGVHRQA